MPVEYSEFLILKRGGRDSQELPLTQLAIGQMVISKTNELQDLGNL